MQLCAKEHTPWSVCIPEGFRYRIPISDKSPKYFSLFTGEYWLWGFYSEGEWLLKRFVVEFDRDNLKHYYFKFVVVSSWVIQSLEGKHIYFF